MEFEDSENFYPLIAEDNIILTPPQESDAGRFEQLEYNSII
jgi:hypothetical protein